MHALSECTCVPVCASMHTGETVPVRVGVHVCGETGLCLWVCTSAGRLPVLGVRTRVGRQCLCLWVCMWAHRGTGRSPLQAAMCVSEACPLG